MIDTDSVSPVVVFAYNRPEKLDNCLNSLEKCEKAESTMLYVFCDGPKSASDVEMVERVREVAKKHARNSVFKNFSIVTQECNKGLAESVISGVTKIVNEYGSVIVVEDDLVVKPSFLIFLNEGLRFYRDEKDYGSISAFTYPMDCLNKYDMDVFATRKAECWGWATWADRWNDAEWRNVDFKRYFSDVSERIQFEHLEAGLDRLMYLQYKGKIDSWAIRWVFYLFRMNMLTVYPKKSRVANEGFDGSGTHCKDGFGAGFNSWNAGDDFTIRWEKCTVDETLADSYAKFPRRNILLYFFETIMYLIRR